ncbi:MAG: ABC transporter permease [Gemmatimonadetes bacterium]|nr:ABC transporter permease [Gemmatimonadota bacterium]
MVEFAKLRAVIKREYVERVRSKWFIIGTLFGPLLFIGMMVVPAMMTARNMRTVQTTDFRILDVTGTALGDRIATSLRERAENAPNRKAMGDSAPPVATTRVIKTTMAELAAAESLATQAVMAEETRGYLVLDSATLRTSAARYAGRNASSIAEMEQIEAALRTALLTERLAAAGVTGPRADSLTRTRANLATERITSRGRGGGSGIAGFIVGFAIAFLLYMMIVLYGQNIMRGVLDEKTTRVAEVVISSVSPDTLLAGKVIGVGAVGLTQQVVWMAFAGGASAYGLGAAAASGVNITLPQFTLFQGVTLALFFLLGFTFYAALFAAIGAMCSTQEETSQLLFPTTMPLIVTIMMVQPILTTPTSGLAQTMGLLPFSSPIIMPMLMSATQVPLWQVGAALLGLVVACIAMVWVSARIYRVGLLMTGKRPSMKELMRWIRYA